MGSHFGCMYNTKTSVHSHNVSVVKNCARLVKDRLDFCYSALLLVSVVWKYMGLVGEIIHPTCP